MPKKYEINTADVEEIKKVRKQTKDKQVDKRLYAVQLRGEGLTNSEIAAKLDTSPKVVSHWVAAYQKNGIGALLPAKITGNHRNATAEEEQAFLAQFEEAAAKGQIITVTDIATAYDERIGKKHKSQSTVYYLLHKYGWRKVMPRSKHPKSASPEEIESSKKLTNEWQRSGVM